MYSEQTQNYQLPQFRDTDAMQPVSDFNPAFKRIDELLYQLEMDVMYLKKNQNAANDSAKEAKANARRAENAAELAAKEAKAAADAIGTLPQQVQSLDTRLDGAETAIGGLDRRVTKLERSDV